MKKIIESGCVGVAFYLFLCIITLEILPHISISISREFTIEEYRNFIICFALFGFFTFAFYVAYQTKYIRWWIALLLHYFSYVGGFTFMVFFLNAWFFDWYRLAIIINLSSLLYFMTITLLKLNDFKTRKRESMK